MPGRGGSGTYRFLAVEWRGVLGDPSRCPTVCDFVVVKSRITFCFDMEGVTREIVRSGRVKGGGLPPLCPRAFDSPGTLHPEFGDTFAVT